MRKILLTATAVASMMGAGAAFAQAPAPTVRPGVTGWTYAPFSGVPSTTAEPGTVQAYFRGRLFFDAIVLGDSGDRVGGGKNQNYAIGEFARIYPSFEGTTANGLKYGAFMEVRQNAGTNGPGGNTGGATMIFRRETGYVGGSWGTVRYGNTDGALGLFQTGTFENFGDNWNGDSPDFFDTATNVTWPFPENSGNYGDSKVVYLSPSLAGFDFGISFEPSTSGSGESNTATPVLGGIRVSSVSAFSNAAVSKQLNTLEVAGRYQGNIGPAAITGMVGIMTSGTVKYNGAAAAPYKMKTPFAFNAGVTVAFGGLAVGGDVYTGSVNPNGSRNTAPVVSGGRDSTSFVLGTSYAFGPFIVGASYLNVNRQGNNWQDLAGATAASVGGMREWGAAVGGTYAWAPGAALSLTYIYGERHQRGVNLYTTASSTAGNNTHAQGLILTNVFTW